MNWPNDVNLTWSKVLTCREYIWPNVNLTWSLDKCQPELKPHLLGVHLTKCQSDPISHLTKWCQPHLTWYLNLQRGTSDQMSVWPEVWPNVRLTQSLILYVHLTKCLPDSISQLTKWCQPDLTWPEVSTCMGYIWPMSASPEVWPNVYLTLYLNWANDVNLTWSEVLTCRWYIWTNFNLTQSLSKCQAHLKPHPRGTFDQV